VQIDRRAAQHSRQSKHYIPEAQIRHGAYPARDNNSRQALHRIDGKQLSGHAQARHTHHAKREETNTVRPAIVSKPGRDEATSIPTIAPDNTEHERDGGASMHWLDTRAELSRR